MTASIIDADARRTSGGDGTVKTLNYDVGYTTPSNMTTSIIDADDDVDEKNETQGSPTSGDDDLLKRMIPGSAYLTSKCSGRYQPYNML